MSKQTQYICEACGHVFNKWSGQCGACNAWNTLVESRKINTSKVSKLPAIGVTNEVIPLADVDQAADTRITTHIHEFDRVLGGGIVRGSVVLLGGSPGIGKSTLLLQMLATLSHCKTLYVSGEESAQQISARADRLKINKQEIRLLSSISLEEILTTLQSKKPDLVIIDSIQTLASEQLTSAPGSVSQVRECAGQLVQYAKNTNTTLFVVGHITKEGTLAGPRVLEHMVDTVLYFAGDDSERYRLLRVSKNRFGAVNELGVFIMQEAGLKEVKNPSALFLSHHQSPAPGSIVMVTREGTRPMLVEVQALVDDNPNNTSRRLAQGIEQNRLSMLLAVLHKHGGIALHTEDVFVNVVGGVRVQEPASDLPVLIAILSSFREFILPSDLFAFGEIGLAGEIRPVPNGQERLREAAKHGFKIAIVPKANAPRQAIKNLEIIAVNRLSDAIDLIIERFK